MMQNSYNIFEDPNYILIEDAYKKEEYIAIELFTPSGGGEGQVITLGGFVVNYTKIGCILEYAQYLEKGEGEEQTKDIAFVRLSINYADIVSVTSPYIVLGEEVEVMKSIRNARSSLKLITSDKTDEPILTKPSNKSLRRTVKLKKPPFFEMLINKIKSRIKGVK